MEESLQQDYSNDDGVEHGFCTELVSLLDPPKAVDADGLSGDAHK